MGKTEEIIFYNFFEFEAEPFGLILSWFAILCIFIQEGEELFLLRFRETIEFNLVTKMRDDAHDCLTVQGALSIVFYLCEDIIEYLVVNTHKTWILTHVVTFDEIIYLAFIELCDSTTDFVGDLL